MKTIQIREAWIPQLRHIYCRKHGLQIPNFTGPACPECAKKLESYVNNDDDGESCSAAAEYERTFGDGSLPGSDEPEGE